MRHHDRRTNAVLSRDTSKRKPRHSALRRRALGSLRPRGSPHNLSSLSYLPFQTFRGAGGWWRNHEATRLATPEAFSLDPSLVWQFYAYRRHKALLAKPNAAHLVLGEYTRQNPGKCFTITQNVDGLSQRAGHPEGNIIAVHGDLWTLRCERECGYEEKNLDDPLVPALKVDEEFPDDEDVPYIPRDKLPHCPKCRSLLRPGVVFFNEQLPGISAILRCVSDRTVSATDTVEEWLFKHHVDLILVIGTSGVVYPAAGYAWSVKMRGGKVAVFNIESDTTGGEKLDDWMFEGCPICDITD